MRATYGLVREGIAENVKEEPPHRRIAGWVALRQEQTWSVWNNGEVRCDGLKWGRGERIVRWGQSSHGMLCGGLDYIEFSRPWKGMWAFILNKARSH